MIKMGFNPIVFQSNIILTMYIKCGRLLDAHQVFDKMSQRSTVSWTRIIVGYAHNGLAKEALSLFYQMHCEGVKLNAFTFVSVVKAMVEVETL